MSDPAAPGWANDLTHLGGLDEAAVAVDLDGRAVHANAAGLRLLAVGSTALCDVDLADALSATGDRGPLDEIFDQVRSGTPWTGRLDVRLPGGAVAAADASCTPIHHSGAVVGALWVVDPIATDGPSGRRARRVADRLTRLARVTGELAAAEDLEAVTEVVTRHAADAVGATVASLSVLVDDMLVLTGLRGGLSGASDRWQSYPVDEHTPAGHVARSGEALVLPDRQAIAARFPDLERAAEGERSMVCLPVRLLGRTLGVFTLSFPGRREVDAPEMEFLRILTDSCAQTLARIRARDAAAAQSARVRFLADVTTELAASLDYGTTLRNVARMAVPDFADWTAIDVVEDDRLHRLAVEHVDPAKVHLALEIEDRYPSDREAPGGTWEVVRSGQSVLIEEITDEMLVGAARDEEHLRLARSLELTSILMVPLMTRGRLFGVMTWATAESGRRLTGSDLALAEDLARRSAVAIDNSQLYSQTRDAAGQLQQAVLPVLPTRLRDWDLAAHYSPAGRTEVGGDFYDAFDLDDGRSVFFVGDVMGRGVDAAAAMAQARAALRAFAAIDPTPDVVLAQMDRLFAAYGLDQLVTLVYGLADAGGHRLSVANAAHPPPLVLRTDGTAQPVARTDEPPLGVAAGARHRVEVDLEVGDALLLYTDGLVERRAEDIDDGIRRLRESTAAIGVEAVMQRLDALVEAVRDHSRDDDVAALVLRRTSA